MSEGIFDFGFSIFDLPGFASWPALRPAERPFRGCEAFFIEFVGAGATARPSSHLKSSGNRKSKIENRK
jgi:hypothetical protein